MNTRLFLAAAAILSFAASSPAFAQTYTLGYDQTRYDVDTGDTVDIGIVLTEEISGAEVARLAPGGGDGLFAFSLGIDYSMFTGTGNGSTYQSLVLDPLFTEGFAGSGEDITDDPGVISFEGAEDFAGNDTDGENGVGGFQIDATTWAINLATVTFVAGDRGTVTELQLQRHVASNANDFLFGNGDTPDIGFAGNSTINVNAIPEPGSAGLIALLAGIGFVRRRRS